MSNTQYASIGFTSSFLNVAEVYGGGAYSSDTFNSSQSSANTPADASPQPSTQTTAPQGGAQSTPSAEKLPTQSSNTTDTTNTSNASQTAAGQPVATTQTDRHSSVATSPRTDNYLNIPPLALLGLGVILVIVSCWVILRIRTARQMK